MTRITPRTRTAAGQSLDAIARDLAALAAALPDEAFALRRAAALIGQVGGRMRSSETAPGGGRDAA